MNLLNHDLKISTSLNQDNFHLAEKFAQAGFEATECCMPVRFREPVDLSVFPDFLKRFHDKVRPSGLKIHSYHIPFGVYWDISSPDEEIRASAVAASAELIRMLADYEGVNIVVHPSFEPIAEDAREAHILACQRSLRELAPIAQAAGKRIALENLPRTCLGRTSQEMERITEGGTLCGICMDTTHMFHETPQEYMNRCGKWIINTHLSDYLNGQDECHWVPGTGSLNWREIFEKLIALGYQGTYNFEVSNYAPLEILGGLNNSLRR